MTRGEVIAAVQRLEAARVAVQCAEADLKAAEVALDRMLAGQALILVSDETRAAALATTIVGMDLSVRATNCLSNAGLVTVADIVQQTPGNLLRMKNLGRKVLNEVVTWLTVRGLSLQPGADGWTGGLR